VPYCILCKMQRVTSQRYRKFLHSGENFCPTDMLARPFTQDRHDCVQSKAPCKSEMKFASRSSSENQPTNLLRDAGIIQQKRSKQESDACA
jgi:hypothetical protein